MNRNYKLEKYINSLSLVYIEAIQNILGRTSVYMEYSVNRGLYTELKGYDAFPDELIKKIKKEMQCLINRALPFCTREASYDEAIEIFESQGMLDKVRVLRTGRLRSITLYRIERLWYAFLGGTLDNTSQLTSFDLVPIANGAVLVYPISDSVAKYENQPRLFQIFSESESWARLLGINHAGDLNETIANRDISDIVRICEALHEKKIAHIADRIQAKKTARLILIAGPSSSGKTTFAKRLGIQLRVLGKKYITIGLDDYFIDRDKTPLGDDGKPNFDAITAVDVRQFNIDLQGILRGERVQVPTYNFITGKREYKKEPVRIDEDIYIIVEGIHGLNEKLTEYIPAEKKFKIYISALTQLNIDNHNRIATTDLRLIRRMVRDIKTRGYSGESTLDLWKNVVHGENLNIFPFQENADVMFNSSLIYELAFLKKHAVPVLKAIPEESPHYEESRRLLLLLEFFNEAKDELAIPNTSIIREFIGGSCFEH